MEQSSKIRFRLHWGGSFAQTDANSQWRYQGGEVFNESLPSDFTYNDLCIRMNEKLNCTTSIKYLTPGDELSPDVLISLGGQDDLLELKEEYFKALTHPTLSSFRIKLFLFPALQDELDTELTAGMEMSHHPDLNAFDPDDWCGDDEEDDSSGQNSSNPFEGDMYTWINEEPRLPSLKSLTATDFVDIENQEHSKFHLHSATEPTTEHYEDLPPGFTPAFVDRPCHGRKQEGLFGASVAVEDIDQQLDRHVMDTLLQSVLSRSAFSPQQRRQPVLFNRRITEEMDLLDPYHEDDGSHGASMGLGVPVKAEGWEGKVSRLRNVAPPPVDTFSSPVGNFLPSHISIFGGTCDGSAGGGARALSGGAGSNGDNSCKALGLGGAEGFISPSLVGGQCQQKWQIVAKAPFDGLQEDPALIRSIHLPSHISVFGGQEGDTSMNEIDDMYTAHHQGTRVITQDFKMARNEAPELDMVAVGQGPVGEPGALVQGDDHGEEAAFHLSTPKVLEEVMQVCMEEVQILRKIGEGAFGEVSYANVSSHGHVAVKWLKKDLFSKHSESFMREAAVLAKLNHPNIIRMYGVIVEPIATSPSASAFSRVSSGSSQQDFGSVPPPPQQAALIAGIMTDYVRGGSLKDQLKHATRCLTLKERCQVAVQASRGMAYLHAQNPAVIHFDLKPDNLLVDGEGDTLNVKVADFGLSKHKFSSFVSCKELRGTLPYMAPELITNSNHVSERCDVWSMGVVMWEMYTREAPYNHMTSQQIIQALLHGNIALRLPQECEPEWRGLVEMCMDANPEARPTFKALMTHLDALLKRLETPSD